MTPAAPSGGRLADELDSYSLERKLRRRGFSRIVGVDEAGRGACAGPLVAAAVMLPAVRGKIAGLTDSKLLTADQREQLYDVIVERAECYSVTVVGVDEVDDGGVHRANLAALRRAVAGLGVSADYVLTDGFAVPGMTAPSLGVWKGDQGNRSIRAGMMLRITRCVWAGAAMVASLRTGQTMKTAFPWRCDCKPHLTLERRRDTLVPEIVAVP